MSKKGKGNETILIVFVGLLIYAFAMYYLVFVYIGEEMAVLNEEIKERQTRLDQLEYYLDNIEDFRKEKEVKTVVDERSNQFLMNEANVIHGIEYLHNLAEIMGESVDEINVVSTRPSSTENGNTYYEFKISFNVRMSYEEIEEIINYIESSALKMKITEFSIRPESQSSSQQSSDSSEANVQIRGAKVYSCTLGITYCSNDVDLVDKLDRLNEHSFIDT